MAVRRARSVANKELDVSAYRSALVSYMALPPSTSLEIKVGPTIVSDIRQVTPAAYSSVQPLLDKLLLAGLTNGVMQVWKFEEAVRLGLRDNPHRAGETSTDKFVPALTQGMMTVCAKPNARMSTARVLVATLTWWVSASNCLLWAHWYFRQHTFVDDRHGHDYPYNFACPMSTLDTFASTFGCFDCALPTFRRVARCV